MWLFLPYGFFSVVEDRNDGGYLWWRTRCREDLLMLMQEHRIRAVIVDLAGEADYRFRVRLSREVSEAITAKAARDIDYPNFKEAVAEHSSHRHLLYSAVYNVMLGADR